MNETAVLLSKSTNYAIVHLPGRQFPGVVMQGDSLHNLVRELSELLSLAEGQKSDELTLGLRDLHEQFQEIAGSYVRVCREQGISLPYPD